MFLIIHEHTIAFNFLRRLINNLNAYAEEDWHLGNLICQVIWNFGIEEDDLFFTLGYQQAQSLLNVLIDLLGWYLFHYATNSNFSKLIFKHN